MESTKTTPKIAIIGAGISGLAMAIGLDRAGIHSFAIYERADRLGGTWRDNTYPGAGCDVPSLLYSYSFEPNPDWSRAFSGQAEILAYLERTAERRGLLSRIQFGTDIAEATFDDGDGRWRLRTAAGQTLVADVVVWACGQLSRPRYPDIPGLDRFRGAAFHSARWDHGFDLRGARVAVIGSGASAVQIVPAIAPDTARLFVFQRSPSWLIPKPERAFAAWERWLHRRFPHIAALRRLRVYAQFESRFPAFLHGSLFAALFQKTAEKHLDEQIADPALRAALRPDYPIGCKRVLLSSDYYPTLARDDVELVTAPIERVTEDAIVTADGRARPVDAIVFATGFATTEFLAPVSIAGRDGVRLADAWRGGASAYLGMAVHGFPNMFLLYGPNTNLGHNSIVFMVERQVGYVVQCARALADGGYATMDVRPQAMARYRIELRRALRRSVFAADCHSWYKTDDGQVTNNWPSSTLRYWWYTRRLAPGDYYFAGQFAGQSAGQSAG